MVTDAPDCDCIGARFRRGEFRMPERRTLGHTPRPAAAPGRRGRARLAALLVLQLVWAGASAAEGGFEADRAFAHLEALSEIGARVAGSEGASRARTWLRERLEETGAEVSEIVTEADLRDAGTLSLTHLLAEWPGESPDRVLLVAHYDTAQADSFRYVGSNASASGAAVVLELARLVSQRARPYTVQALLLEGERLRRNPDTGATRYLGSKGVAELWRKDGRFVGIRLALFFGQVGDPDLTIARDLRSSRIHRNRMWAVAEELGHADAFPPDAPLESPPGSHVAFADQGLRAFVAVTDDRFGGDEPPGIFDYTEKDTPEHCSAASLGTVGEVSATTLERIEAHLVRIDSFVRRPRPDEDVPVDDTGPEGPPDDPSHDLIGSDDGLGDGSEDSASPAPETPEP
jgi:hypothetical protein